MTANEIRLSFLDFFTSKEHRIVPSAPVVPHDDPTLLFTNAGMNQFKDVFLGTGVREYRRAADTQKCIRVSGKHNDLEEVGRDTYHHTFFEMLGNWSFGDYYKKEAIEWAWELLTAVWKLPKERLYATVYKDDEEAFNLWTTVTDIDPDHVMRFGEKDNFWEMGETGPCGPCSEVHIDLTDDLSGKNLVNAGTPEAIEIWNLVFIQYNRDSSGALTELPAKHVDTGMGFERICAVIQGKKSNYDSDIFMPILRHIERVTGAAYEGAVNQVAMRVIADHARMLTFAIADGAIPGNEGRGYVLRRILRRAARFGRNLGVKEPFLWKIVEAVVAQLGDVFPEIGQQRAIVEKIIAAEEESFNATLDRGLEIFEHIVSDLAATGSKTIDGKDVFKLYDTFGFPLDLTSLLAEERGLTVDTEGFEQRLAEQKERSRSVTKSKTGIIEAVTGSAFDALNLNLSKPTEFLGYESLEVEAQVIDVKRMDGHAYVVLDKSPFYVESGGQVSDTGSLVAGGGETGIIGLAKHEGNIIHITDGNAETVSDTGTVLARVDARRRWDIMRNHTVTHLLHAALRRILGTHVQQAGSMVAPDRLRFDFSHYQKVSDEEIRDIEAMVNEKILDRLTVQHHRDISFEDAKKMGALMFFGDKYGDRVNVIQIEDYSLEFCGGTHVRNTSQIGLFKIVSESSIASGTRRIEAVTGRGVDQYLQSLQQLIVERDNAADQLHDRIKSLEKEVSRLSLQQSGSQLDRLLAGAEQWEGANLVIAEVTADTAEQLKSMGDMLRDKLGSGVGMLAAVVEGKVSLVCVVTDDIISSRGMKAGEIVGKIAKLLGGGGGGKPHLATAGAKDTQNLKNALQQAADIIKQSGK